MPHKEHKRAGPDSVSCKVITVSDTRDKEKDGSGSLIVEMLEREEHEVVSYVLVKDDSEQIEKELLNAEAEVCILNGGTGISQRDITPDTVEDIIDKKLEGFGELFRQLSYDEIGSSAMLSRAVGGIIGDKIIFCLPGSQNAVKLGMEELILPELGHLVHEVNK